MIRVILLAVFLTGCTSVQVHTRDVNISLSCDFEVDNEASK